MKSRFHIHIILTGILAAFLAVQAKAQDDVEYRAEIGGGGGMTTYYGDFSTGLFSNMQPAGAVVLRVTPNPHMAFRVSGMYTQLKGKATDVKTHYELIKDMNYSFETSVADLSVTYEYNFWAYGTGKEYRGAQRVAPFISIGLGATYASNKNHVWDMASDGNAESSSKNVFTANVPIGIGVKYRIGDRMNLSLDWQMHFSLSDQLDGMKDPYGISSSGLFKNTDCYSTLMLALTYSFSAKCSTCHKE